MRIGGDVEAKDGVRMAWGVDQEIVQDAASPPAGPAIATMWWLALGLAA